MPILTITRASAPSWRIAVAVFSAPPPQWLETFDASILVPCSSSRKDDVALVMVMRSTLRLSTSTTMSIMAEPMHRTRMQSP